MIIFKKLLIGLVTVVVFFSLNSCTEKASKPNVLLVLTDDQGWGDVSLHGNDILNTPNMERIATEGARFDRFFVSCL